MIFGFQYSFFLLVFFLLEMFIAVAGFVFPHTMQSLLDETFTDKIITSYREDPDLQNLIDFGQKKVPLLRRFFRFSSDPLSSVPVLRAEPHGLHGLAEERILQLHLAQCRELRRAILLLHERN